MAYYNVPAQCGRQVPLQTEDRDRLSTLDVVWANKYEVETISPTRAKEMELKFYKGTPPQWLNFYWAEQINSPFVKRDRYQELRRKINEIKNTSWSIDHINLFHKPGSGGSTLAMQVLWDLRKELRCAKVLDSSTDPKATAQQVLRLFLAGGSENQNTVLLLLDNKYTSEDASFLESLEEKLCDEIKANNITTTIPVVIILNCIRQTHGGYMGESMKNINLNSNLSTTEKMKFDSKLSDIIQTHGGRHTELHAFNIMQSNDSKLYVENVCRTLLEEVTLKEKWKTQKHQLLAILALINSYIPGSDLPQDFCQLFFKMKADHFSLETQMQPFTDFLAIFSTSEEGTKSEDFRVRFVHPMIAHEFQRLLTEAGVTRSDTTLMLLGELCDTMPPCLEKTIKKLLTKREQDNSPTRTQNKFSKLILDINRVEKKSMCIAVLTRASDIFKKDPFYPQALARFYYIEQKAYDIATDWAKMAIKRDERNSFIRDTLGQVKKNYLDKNRNACAIKILQIGEQATNAFKDEQKVSENEEVPAKPGMKSTIFNTWGIFGYMQVAKIIFESLKEANEEWGKIFTTETNPDRFLQSYEEGKCEKYKSLITSLRDEVENRFEFFEWYHCYSNPKIDKKEKWFRDKIDDCYDKFVKQSQENKSALQILKEKKVSTFAGLLSIEGQGTDLELITEQWNEIYLSSPSEAKNIQNYILAQVLLSQRCHTSAALRPLEELQTMLYDLWTKQKDPRDPEFYLLVLLLFLPDAQKDRRNGLNISECVQYMNRSFERTYKYFLRSRYLRPLFFLSEGNGLQRFVQNSCRHNPIYDLTKDRKLILARNIPGCDSPQLQHVRGEVRNYKVFAVQGSEMIEVSPDHPASVCGQGQVSFCLGLNIKGPVAYNIRYEK